MIADISVIMQTFLMSKLCHSLDREEFLPIGSEDNMINKTIAFRPKLEGAFRKRFYEIASKINAKTSSTMLDKYSASTIH